MYKLLGRATSGNVQKVLFLLEELGVAYEREDYGRQFGNTLTPEYFAINPTRKVPTLVDGDLTIWESHTILRYVAAKEASGMYPAAPGPRTHVERWMDWMLAALNPVFLGGYRDMQKPENERSPATAAAIQAELTILDGQLAKQSWIAGAEFSLADICIGPIARRCMLFPLGNPKLANLEGWRARLEQRPAFMKAIAAG